MFAYEIGVWLVKVQKRFDLINQTDIIKTSFNVAKKTSLVKKMLTKIMSFSKLRIIVLTKSYINLFHYTMQLSNIIVRL